MRIVIAGGAGMIGSALARRLAGAGHELILLSRSPERHQGEFSQPKIRLVQWDGKTVGEWAQHIEGADAVVNVAGASISGGRFPPKRWTPRQKELILHSRVDASRALVEAIKQAANRPKTFLQQGAVGIYGSQPDDRIITEDSPISDSKTELTAYVQVETEAAVKELEGMGLRVIYTRTGIVFSNEGEAFTFLVIPFKYFIIAGGPLGSGSQWYSWIHVDDLTRAMQFLLEHANARGPINTVSPEPARQKTVAKAIGKAMGRPSFMPLPGFVLRLALGEVAAVVLDGQRVVPKRLQELGFEFKHPDVFEAARDLLSR